MKSLSQLQNHFQLYLFQDDAQFRSMVVNTEKVSADTRLRIYQNAYHWRLIDALASNFPLLKVYVGDDIFESIAKDYIEHHPSTFRSIRWFGDQFSSFLNQHQKYQDYPYLSEFAQFEWSQALAFDAAEDKVLETQELVPIPPEAWASLQFCIHPSVQRVNLFWNIGQLWLQLSNEETPDEPMKQENPIGWIIWRHQLINHFYSLAQDEAWAIDALISKREFGDICEGLCQWHPEQDAGMRAASLLNGWITSGIISQIKGYQA